MNAKGVKQTAERIGFNPRHHQNCQSNKQWSDIMPVCDLKECGELPRVDHCSFNPTSGTCGIKTQLTCDR